MLRIRAYIHGETFHDLNFRSLKPIRENRENYVPQKFGTIQYIALMASEITCADVAYYCLLLNL